MHKSQSDLPDIRQFLCTVANPKNATTDKTISLFCSTLWDLPRPNTVSIVWNS